MPNTTNKSEEANRPESNDTERPGVAKRCFNFLFKGKAAFWTAVFTGVLSFYTIKLVQISRHTDDTTRTSERAVLNFSGIGLGARIVSDLQAPQKGWNGYEFNLAWQNSGNTPAKDLVIRTNASPFFPDLPQQYDFPLIQDKTHAVIGAKANYSTTMLIPKGPLVDSWRGKSKTFIWGTVIYKDVFSDDPERLSEFCVQITHLTAAIQQEQQPTPPKGRVQATPPPAPIVDLDSPNALLTAFQWQQCPAHNCYDEDCVDYKDRIKDMR